MYWPTVTYLCMSALHIVQTNVPAQQEARQDGDAAFCQISYFGHLLYIAMYHLFCHYH